MITSLQILLLQLSSLGPGPRGIGALLREFDTTLNTLEPWVLSIYYGSLVALSVYALHRLHLLFLLRRKDLQANGDVPEYLEDPSPAHATSTDYPYVTIQLPVYNERSVVRRLINAVAQIDYPKERLEIQVLDDSTDETSSIVAERVAHWQGAGLHVRHHRRTQRSGYKAGALAEGLACAKGDLIAIFDADFVPQPDFLRRVIPHFAEPSVGMVQARWDHLNRTASLLTRIQAMLLDGHFLIEHEARSKSNRLFNFNGTAGVWRRKAIDDGGGWQHDTLTEDLDLSYRSQLAGWTFRFLPDLGVPAELPDNLGAYRGQQRRWTRGSAQTLRKLGRRLVRSPLTPGQRFEALAHLSANLGYPLTVVVALLLPWVVYLRHLGAEPTLLWLDLGLLGCGTLSLCAFYLEAVRRRGNSLWLGLVLMPPLLALCIGLAWHNAKAALGGLLVKGGEFERTPKQGSANHTLQSSRLQSSRMQPAHLETQTLPNAQPDTRGIITTRAARRYRQHSRFPWGETIIALYLGCASLLLAAAGAYLGLPFLLLFFCGFGSAAATLWRPARQPRQATVVSENPVVLCSEVVPHHEHS